MNKWKETTLGEVAEFSNGRTSPERFDSGKYEVFGSNGVIGLSDETNSDANTIIIGRVGSYCGSLYFSKNKCWVTDNAIKANAKENSDPFYLYYLLITQQLNSKAAGSGQPLINQEILNSIEVNIPPLPEQKAIAAVLSSFDDKIELLRRQNKTLESMAQTIFKEWFIKYNFPNEKGKPYKNSNGIMIDSELGKIPKGWKIGTLGDLLELAYGKALKEEERTGKGYPVIGSSGIVGCHSEYLAEEFGIVVGRKGSIGTIIWIEDKFFPIDTTFYVVDKLGIRDLFFHYFVLKNIDLQKIGSDSAVPGLNRTLVYSLEFVIPKKEAVEEFNKTVKPIFEKMKNNNSQIQTLSKLRDTLLPKLLKGEIRVLNQKSEIKNQK